jgi:DICT domain-containing protein
MRAAVERALRAGAPPEDSIFAALRRKRPDLPAYALPKRTLIALSHAIEDECAARAEHPVLFGAFQRERFYRASKPRWRELAGTAELAVVFADFEQRGDPDGGPVELPIGRCDPLAREWAVVCDAPGYSACLSAWEPPGQDCVDDGDRVLETVWSVEPDVVRLAACVAREIAARCAPDAVGPADRVLGPAPDPSVDDLRRVSALTNRIVAYVAGGAVNSPPALRAATEA